MVPSVATEKKIPGVTPPGIDPEIVRLVTQCLNHYATPGPVFNEEKYKIRNKITNIVNRLSEEQGAYS
jgi:hypothetical protein